MIVKSPRRIVICESSMFPLWPSSTSATAAAMPGWSFPTTETAKFAFEWLLVGDGRCGRSPWLGIPPPLQESS